MCKQLNGPDLKLLKSVRFWPKYEKKKKLAGPGPDQDFVFRFGPGRARAEISTSLSGRARSRPKFLSLRLARPGRDCCHAGWASKIQPVQTSNTHTHDTHERVHTHRPISETAFWGSGDLKTHKSGKNSTSKILTENNTSIT